MAGARAAHTDRHLDGTLNICLCPRTSKALSKQAADKSAELAKLNGGAFDKAYIDNEVAYHKTVGDALQNTLIPSASNPELKDLLTTGLKIFQGHEQHAEQVAGKLK
jgi:putative membrane protein